MNKNYYITSPKPFLQDAQERKNRAISKILLQTSILKDKDKKVSILFVGK
ncbi:MAG: hypothetical protein Q8930_13980 [Bacillota bacterium]|nr:hypothetical protein [Bacillota bacterium]